MTVLAPLPRFMALVYEVVDLYNNVHWLQYIPPIQQGTNRMISFFFYLLWYGITAYPKYSTLPGREEIDGAWLLGVVGIVHLKYTKDHYACKCACLTNLLGKVKCQV